MAKQDKVKRLHAQRDAAIIARDAQVVELTRLRRERDDLAQALREDHQSCALKALDVLGPKAKRGGARRGTCGVCGNPLHGGRCFDCEEQEV